jgi:electron transport complex protein RnfB
MGSTEPAHANGQSATRDRSNTPVTGDESQDAASAAACAPLESLTLAIDAILPQTQCAKCGFAGCLPYARAIACEQAPINRCPPGGEEGIAALARLLRRPVLALDPSCGTHHALHVAWIDEPACIGCTLCIQACPVDAIAGAAKAMHTVVAAECTGCELCVAPCPMDCIRMVPVQPPRAWTRLDANAARRRLHERRRRLEQERRDTEERLAAKAVRKLGELEAREDLAREEIERRKAVVQRAMERARLRRAAPEQA